LPTTRETPQRNARAELQTWYLTSLRPKVLRAAGADVVEAAAAEELHRQLCEFLDVPGSPPEPAA
jgi:hypothetical protein